jgi:hypothetical protein
MKDYLEMMFESLSGFLILCFLRGCNFRRDPLLSMQVQRGCCISQLASRDLDLVLRGNLISGTYILSRYSYAVLFVL